MTSMNERMEMPFLVDTHRKNGLRIAGMDN